MRLTKLAWLRLALVMLLLQLCILIAGRRAGWGPTGSQADVEAAPAWEEQAPLDVDVNCRYGVAIVSSPQIDKVAFLRAGWFINFGIAVPGSGPTSAEFVPIIRVKQNKDAQGNYLPGYNTQPNENYLLNYVDDQPGALWIVGNEIDRGPDPGETEGGQGDIFPEVYAQAYHNLYHLIKGHDPTAQIAISALVEVTPGRLQYLDNVWNAYLQQYGTPMPVDVWNMHLYVLPEAQPNGQPNGIASKALGTHDALMITESYDPDGSGPLTFRDSCPLDTVYCWAEHDDMVAFEEQIIAMRTWMKQHGQQHKPLILSEYSILYPYIIDDGGTCFLTDEYGSCFTPQRVSAFATATMNYLENQAFDTNLGYPADNYRLLQQWLWFSVANTGVGSASNLLSDDLSTLTQVGQTFKSYITAQSLMVNLLPTRATARPAFTGPPSNTASATLTVRLLNNGNRAAIPFTVTFYADAELTQPIGSAVVQEARGCARTDYWATTTWHDLPSGVHTFWAKVDSQNVIGEVDENDNVISGLVMIDPYQTFGPIVSR